MIIIVDVVRQQTTECFAAAPWVSPGDGGWMVDGKEGATTNHALVRRGFVSGPSSVFEDAQWASLPHSESPSMGTHTMDARAACDRALAPSFYDGLSGAWTVTGASSMAPSYALHVKGERVHHRALVLNGASQVLTVVTGGASTIEYAAVYVGQTKLAAEH